VITDKGSYDADLVLVSIGVLPNTDFLSETSIKRTKNGACLVNRYMETSVKDIYAGGDCATIYNRQLDIQQYIPMGNNANKQGKLIAENISGNNVQIDGVLGTIVIKVLNMEAAKTGITERYAIENHIKHEVVSVKGNNHAGYYPNPEKIHVKIIYNPDTKQILGAQLVGKKDTALRINSFVVAISKGMTTKEFGMLDLAYAPPFAGVWDITAIAANNAK
jgi:NADPH-dependent 2,4-dienoyl-CoA reductase/sulfur reductase-like enzyme